MTRHSHHRWSVGLAGTLAFVAVGLLYGSPAPLLLAVVPLSYVAYGALSRYPEPTLDIERSLSPSAPTPGSTVTVQVTVTNGGDRTLPDLRVVDGVPDELAVTDGTPRAGLAIPAGESRSFTYAVMAKRGEYAFGSPVVRARSISGSRVVTTDVEPGGATTLSCSTTVDRTPIDRTARRRTGTLPTDSGGPGLEFYSTREYRPGDPVSRLDWRRLARTDELSTIDFREEQATRLVVLVDARPPARIAPRPGYPTGAGLAAYAGERVYEAVRSGGHQVGVSVLGLDAGDRPGHGAGLPWVEPPAEGGSVAAARALFEAAAGVESDANAVPDPVMREWTGDATAVRDHVVGQQAARGDADEPARSDRADGPDRVEQLLARLPPGAQVLLVSPLLDDEPSELTETLLSRGVPVTVLSPDVTGSDTPGGRVAALRRRNTVTSLQFRGVTVVEWPPNESLEVVIDRSLPEVIS
ncbi:DUF58 domain-containing protein [Halapricum desulfuricans]|uniref:Putative membrane anchored protein with extracellular vWF domain and Ig-like domain n=1 Tax=Halapricum desulfuricans TaxID=2841257 RepID=A0A897N3D6_9EURY|nr:DUF58 domain-containing protein [Halapricum desulfuricans]QSG05265.1 putative membrane anchored protein with extracellular vWF domain and Ig-like domain [Halapricum desulfuricans]